MMKDFDKNQSDDLEEIYEILHGERFQRQDDDTDLEIDHDISLDDILKEYRDGDQLPVSDQTDAEKEAAQPQQPTSELPLVNDQKQASAQDESASAQQMGQDKSGDVNTENAENVMHSKISCDVENAFCDYLTDNIDDDETEKSIRDNISNFLSSIILKGRGLIQNQSQDKTDNNQAGDTIKIEEPFDEDMQPAAKAADDNFKELLCDYKKSRMVLLGKTAIIVFCTVLLAYIEYVPLMGFNLPDLISENVYPVFNMMLQLVLFSIILVSAWREIYSGVKNLILMKSDIYSIIAFSSVVVAVHGFVQISDVYFGKRFLFFGSVMAISFAITFIIKLKKQTAIINALAMLSKSKSIHSAVRIEQADVINDLYRSNLNPDETDKVIVFRKRSETTKDFDLIAGNEDRSNSFALLAAPIMIGCILLATALAVIITKDVENIFAIFAVLSAVSAPFTLEMMCSLPTINTMGKLCTEGAAIAGYTAAESINDAEGIIITDNDIFPNGSIVLKGLRIYNDNRVDEMLIDTASVLCVIDCALSVVFLNVLNNDRSLLRKVETWEAFGDGIHAVINGREFHLGNDNFLRKSGLFLPRNIKNDDSLEQGQHFLFVACDGELACSFLIGYNVDLPTAQLLKKISDTDITIFLKTYDMNIKESDIINRFGLRTNIFKTIDNDLSSTISKIQHETDASSTGIYMASSALRPFASTVLRCSKLKSMISRNILLTRVSMVATPVFIFFLILMNGITQVNPMNVLLFLLLWTVPVCINSTIFK